MANGNIEELVKHGLTAMKAGSDIAAEATAEISNDVKASSLKAALEEGNKTSKEWADRIDRAVKKVGGDGQAANPILEAHYEVSRRIREQAPDDVSRDLGVIAAGQLALHYWIAAFGTMASYTKQLGLTDVASDMKSSCDQAKQADEKYTTLAKEILATG